MDISKKKIVFIDLDDTLITTSSKASFPKGIWDMELKMKVFEQLKKLHPLAVLIASNQGGIELGIVPKQLFEPKFIYVIASLQEFIGFNTLVAGNFCISNDKENPNRKPNTGMLNEMKKQFEKQIGNEILKEECLYIGDMSGLPGNHGNTDLKTAENFGCDYLDVNEFIHMELPECKYKVIKFPMCDVVTEMSVKLENLTLEEASKSAISLNQKHSTNAYAYVQQLWMKPIQEAPEQKPQTKGKTVKMSTKKK